MSILTAFRKKQVKGQMISFFFSHIQQTVGAALVRNIILKIPLITGYV